MLSIVVATAENNAIGKNNALLWNLPYDLLRFKEITQRGSRTLIMGRKTFEAIGKILPGRLHIILTRDITFSVDNENVKIVHDINALLPYINAPEEYFVIGGGEIYSLLLPYSSKLYLTSVHDNFEGDTFFPDINYNEWELISCSKDDATECEHSSSFSIFIRI